MAKKLQISFLGNPPVGPGFGYAIVIDGQTITYDSGFTRVDVDFISTSANIPPNQISIKPTVIETVENTIAFLRQVYNYSTITYYNLGDKIEIVVNNDDVDFTSGGSNTPEILFDVIDIPTIGGPTLKYYFQYKNIVKDEYLAQIFQKGFAGSPIEIHGRCTIDKGSIKSNLDAIRGTGVSIDLEANLNLTLEDLYTENEQDFTIELYKNNKKIFVGFIKPDGVYQSFTRDNWIITLDCVDGLGALSNLSFVQENGLHFVGKMKALDIVYYCLKRTGISLPINIAINTFYHGLTVDDTTDILAHIYLNADRFRKVDDETLMSCEEVLKSVLDIFCACITQIEGEWYIFKPNDLYYNNYITFHRYDIDNVYKGEVKKNLYKKLGSQIDNFYPHWCNSNQRIDIGGAISAYRLNYKFGYIQGLFDNPQLIHDGNLVYEDWTTVDSTFMVNDPNSNSGFIFINQTTPEGAVTKVISDPVGLFKDDLLKMVFDFEVTASNGRPSTAQIAFEIKQGSYYLTYDPIRIMPSLEDVIQGLYWTQNIAHVPLTLIKNGIVDLPLPPLPEDGDFTVAVVQNNSSGGGLTKINSFQVSGDLGTHNPIVGEFHTVSFKEKVSSIVKENQVVYNGDNPEVIYIGAIFKEDKITPTDVWYRKGYFESKALLRIAAEEQLRIMQRPQKIFSGDIYGEIPYLSVVEINNLNGRFLLIEYSYNTFTNICNLKLLELFNMEIPDLQYLQTWDYGKTVKPTIKS